MIKPLSRSAVARIASLLIGFGAIGACTINTDVSKASALLWYSGDGQGAPPNTALKDPLVLLVVNQFGARLKGIQVSWAIATGGGTLSAATSLSDDNGMASISYTTGPNPGTAVINAGVRGIVPISFLVTIQQSVSSGGS
ncbi:MAG TPA: hypothetical protein VGN73_13645 [Gemmatimonadaceae bacterium]|jgi:hypothetical protein|nr:hypothetical protein [Gemmatimonadaceae bacterium]